MREGQGEKLESNDFEGYPLDEQDLYLEFAKIWSVIKKYFTWLEQKNSRLDRSDKEVLQSLKDTFSTTLNYYQQGDRKKVIERLRVLRTTVKEFEQDMSLPEVQIDEIKMSKKERLAQARQDVKELQSKVDSNTPIFLLLDKLSCDLEEVIQLDNKEREKSGWQALNGLKESDLAEINKLLEKISSCV